MSESQEFIVPSAPKTVKSVIKEDLKDNLEYSEPDWALKCPAELGYNLEVIKSGTILTDSSISLSNASFCVFGREPRLAITDLHKDGSFILSNQPNPWLGRVHAIIQYGQGAEGLGWYIMDNNSRHGSFVNKRQLPANKFLRLKVGHIFKFGQSTRLHILQGPNEDIEMESEKTWTQLKQARENQLKKLEEPSEEKIDLNSDKSTELVCSWGMSDDVCDGEEGLSHQIYNANDFLKNIGSESSALNYETHYITDPLQYLMNFFERESLDPAPEFRFVEASYGQKVCKLDIPLESGTIVVESPIVSGRKIKETKAACALQACQILDRLGEFDPAKSRNATSLERQKAQLAQNDYYSSDEDIYLDRTGEVERRRKRRMKRFGAADDPDEVQQMSLNKQFCLPKKKYLSNENRLEALVRLEELGKKLVELEDGLQAAKDACTTGTNLLGDLNDLKRSSSELDELERYMKAIKSGVPNREERLAMRAEIFKLRQEEAKLLILLGLPSTARANSQKFNLLASSKAATAVRKVNIKLNLESKTASNNKELDEKFQEEFDEDESSSVLPSQEKTMEQIAKVQSQEPTLVEKNFNEKTPKILEQDNINFVIPSECANPNPVMDNKSSLVVLETQDEVLELTGQNKILTHHGKTSKVLQDVKDVKEMKQNSMILSDKYDYEALAMDSDYTIWLPPSDQCGDGKTSLNEKYGY